MPNLDHYQQAFVNAVADPDGPNLIANALAGSGKSTVVEASVTALGPQASTLTLAFNKSTADAMQMRLERAGLMRAKAQTFNSLGHRAVCQALGQIKIDRFKSGTIMRELGIHFPDRQDQMTVEKLVGLAKSGTAKPSEISWSQLSTHMGFAVGDADMEGQIYAAADAVFKHSIDMAINRGIIDFNDQLYLPVLKSWAMPRTPFVFVDESQDLSAVQIAMLGRITGRRLFCVGDEHQAIYGFRGASSAAIQQLSVGFSLASYPLNICYRCDTAVISHVQRLVPEIEARPGAGEGSVTHMDEREDKLRMSDFREDDMVICRTNAPLFSIAASFIDKRRAFQIKGDGISEALNGYIYRILSKHGLTRANDPKVDAFMPMAREWFQKEEQRYEKVGQFGLADALADYASILENLARVEGVKRLGDIYKVLDQILAGKTGPTLSSVHRAKGLEAPRVFILEPHLMPSPRAKEQWQKQQERNLMYVAETRAMHDLVYLPKECVEV